MSSEPPGHRCYTGAMESFKQNDILDWASASEQFDILSETIGSITLVNANEAQTRFDVIDSIVRSVLGWQIGQVKVEERTKSRRKYVDYILRVADTTIVIEAKRIGAAFPSPTRKGRLKISGAVLGTGEIAQAIEQAKDYAQAKNADLVCVTNGTCWCIFSMHDLDNKTYAKVLFPFSVQEHASELFDLLSEPSARKGNYQTLIGLGPVKSVDRLVTMLNDADGRVNRNTIADHIAPALNTALYADALISNPESLEKCFVATEGRSKFDSLLGMHLADPKPTLVRPAPRIKTTRQNGPIEKIISADTPDHAPPVTLIIGPVGAGKSTYLKHFELVSGKKILEQRSAHWVYIDFEKMGREGSPRSFLYSQLRDYLLNIKPSSQGNYESLIKPAYEQEINGLISGPLALVAGNKEELNRRITDYIQEQYNSVEPYVDKLFGYLSKHKLCVIVLDNVDLYEDENLETQVFSEGLALSKRINVNVIVSLRDRTFVNHRNSPTFNAYELRKLWLDPPPFRQVLSNRLVFSRKILSNKKAKIAFDNGMQLIVPDLGVFFDIVQRSILQGPAGTYIENMADLNIRRGLLLVNNFLTSGHIHADRALKYYIEGQTAYHFPFHEIFKGTVLGQFKHYREKRAECINIFDSRKGVKRLRLLRIGILNHLYVRAQNENTLEVPVKECIDIFATCGASSGDVIDVLKGLHENALIRTVTASSVSPKENIVIARSGGYYLKQLSRKFAYVEQCMLDTAIEDPDVWQELQSLTTKIESHAIETVERMGYRKKRVVSFVKYLKQLEESMYEGSSGTEHLKCVDLLMKDVIEDVTLAESKAKAHRNIE